MTVKTFDENGLIVRLYRVLQPIPESLIQFLARIAIAPLFFISGRAKVDGITLTNNTKFLAEHEWNLPLLPPALVAGLAAISEHVFPILLILGLATRLSAAALFAMTLVIQIFIYPDAWSTHIVWFFILLYIMARGPGSFSLDNLITATRRL